MSDETVDAAASESVTQDPEAMIGGVPFAEHNTVEAPEPEYDELGRVVTYPTPAELFEYPLVDQDWQSEPGGEGATIEGVIDACVARLERFQASDFACAENAEAIVHLRAARAALDLRTARRRAQGIEGSLAAHVSAG